MWNYTWEYVIGVIISLGFVLNIQGDQNISVHLTITVNHQVHRYFWIIQYIL